MAITDHSRAVTANRSIPRTEPTEFGNPVADRGIGGKRNLCPTPEAVGGEEVHRVNEAVLHVEGVVLVRRVLDLPGGGLGRKGANCHKRQCRHDHRHKKDQGKNAFLHHVNVS